MVDEESFCEADAAKLLRAWLQRAQVAKSGLDLDLFSHLFHVFSVGQNFQDLNKLPWESTVVADSFPVRLSCPR